MKKLSVFFLLIAVLFSSEVCKSQIVLTLKPGASEGKDAQLDELQSKADVNNGQSSDVIATEWTFGGTPAKVRSVFEFDISSIPQGSVVSEALLTLYASGSDAASGGHSTRDGSNEGWLRRVTSPWEENTVTWNTQPSATTVNQVSLHASNSVDEDYLDIDVTLLVQDMVNDPDNSHGFLFRLQNESYYRRLNFRSSDYSDSSKHPTIVITYYVPELAEVTTGEVYSISTTKATASGNITNLGSPDPIQHGFCWGTTETPTIEDDITEEGILDMEGLYTSNIRGLIPNTTYYIRAYVTNSAGTSYGEQLSFTTDDEELAEVSTDNVVEITTSSVVATGNITNLGAPDPTQYGFCWSTEESPTTADNVIEEGATDSTGAWASMISSLSPSTTYYLRAFVTNDTGTSYGEQLSFTTEAERLAVVSTGGLSEISARTAVISGNINDLGAPNPTQHGFCWSTTELPTIADNVSKEGVADMQGAFTSNISGLSPDMSYYIRAYATNNAGTSYGEQVLFTTEPVYPEVMTLQVSDVTSTTVTANGRITELGVPNLAEHGFCWSTTGSPTINDSKSEEGSADATGVYSSTISGLTANTTYTLRAYAISSEGTVYGQQISFTTDPILANVSTESVADITITTAIISGTIIDLGIPNPTEHGFCWSTTESPTILDNITEDGFVDNIGEYTSTITGLTPSTTYYIKAYATNSAGTVYGEQLSFTTEEVVLPTIEFNQISASGDESVSSINLQIDLSNAFYQDVKVDYSVGGTVSIDDVENLLDAGNGTLTISSGVSSVTFNVSSIIDDLIEEEDETIVFTLSNPQNATLGDNTTFTYTIIDNDDLTNTSDILDEELNIYPNPCSDYLYLELGGEDFSNIYVSDFLGRKVFVFNDIVENKLDVSSLKNGVYVLTLVNYQGIKTTFKFVKQ